MGKPGLANTSKTLRAHELASYSLLTQGDRSGAGLVYGQWLKSMGMQPANTIIGSRLVALMGSRCQVRA